MKKELKRYIDSQDLPGPIQKRIDELYEECARVCPEEIEDLFISEHVTASQQPEYESLDCFSESYHVCAYITDPESAVSLTAIYRRLRSIKVAKREYDWKEGTRESRLSVDAQTEERFGLRLRASGRNCDHLREILHRRIQPNLAGREVVSRGARRSPSTPTRVASRTAAEG